MDTFGIVDRYLGKRFSFYTHTQNDIVIFWGRQSVLALLPRTQSFSYLSSNLTKLGHVVLSEIFVLPINYSSGIVPSTIALALFFLH